MAMMPPPFPPLIPALWWMDRYRSAFQRFAVSVRFCAALYYAIVRDFVTSDHFGAAKNGGRIHYSNYSRK
jgi:hypothetical protein